MQTGLHAIYSPTSRINLRIILRVFSSHLCREDELAWDDAVALEAESSGFGLPNLGV
jgi:hypothetical protein